MLRPRTFALSLATILAFAFAACGGDDAPSATNTPPPGQETPAAESPTPTPETETPATPVPATPTGAPTVSCPDADPSVCAFARLIDEALRSGRYTDIVPVAFPREVTCGESDSSQGYDPDRELCEGKPDGTVITAYNIGRTYSEGASVDAQGLANYLRGLVENSDASVEDAFGSGALRMFSIGSWDDSSGRMLVYTRVVLEGERYIREGVFFHIQPKGDSWEIGAVFYGIQFGNELQVKLRGGEIDSATYTVWNPVDGTDEVGGKGLWYGAGVKATDLGGECLNIRDAAGPSGNVVSCVAEGTAMMIIGGPVEVDGVKFWRLQGPVTGYASGEYLAIDA